MVMGAKLLAAIEALKKAPWVVLALLLVGAVGALAQFTGAAKTLIALVHPAKSDPRAELAKLGIAFTPEAMVKAATDGDARAVGLLLDAGMPVDTAPDPALPPLMLAAQSGSVATVERLLAAGADPARVGAAGTALAYAVYYHHPDVLKLLLTRPLPPPVIRDAFVNAGLYGDIDAIALVAPHVADRRAAATDALHALVVESHGTSNAVSAIAALAAYKPDFDAVDDNGVALLHLAVDHDVVAVLTALLKAGANPNQRAYCRNEANPVTATPLACAATRGSSDGLASVNALIAAHADIEAGEVDGVTPLMLAAGNGDAAVTAALLKAGANSKARDAKGRSAIDYAKTADYNDPKATIALLSRA